jgi:hypothetical protein
LTTGTSKPETPADTALLLKNLDLLADKIPGYTRAVDAFL